MWIYESPLPRNDLYGVVIIHITKCHIIMISVVWGTNPITWEISCLCVWWLYLCQLQRKRAAPCTPLIVWSGSFSRCSLLRRAEKSLLFNYDYYYMCSISLFYLDAVQLGSFLEAISGADVSLKYCFRQVPIRVELQITRKTEGP